MAAAYPRSQDVALCGAIAKDLLPQLCAQAAAPALRALDLIGGALTPASLAALCAAPFLSQLTRLTLALEKPERVPAVLDLPALRKLEVRPAGSMLMPGAVAERVAGWRLPELRAAALSKVGGEGSAAALLSAPWMNSGRLESLELHWGPPRPLGAALAARPPPPLGCLTRLDLGEPRLGARELTALLAAAPGLRSLGFTRQELGGTPAADAAAAALAAAALPSLAELRLHYCSLAPGGLSALCGAPWFGGLETLILVGNNLLGAAGLRKLCAARLPRLRAFTYNNNGAVAPAEYAAELGGARWLRQLEHLAIGRPRPQRENDEWDAYYVSARDQGPLAEVARRGGDVEAEWASVA